MCDSLATHAIDSPASCGTHRTAADYRADDDDDDLEGSAQLPSSGEAVAAAQSGIAEGIKKVQETTEKVVTDIKDAAPKATERLTTVNGGLGLTSKLFLGAVVVGACYAVVRAYAPRRRGFAGRHGAYQRGGLI